MAAPISDLYARYKLGTKRVVQWLADTAGRSSDGVDGPIVTLSTNDITELADSIAEAATNNAPPKDLESIIRILEDVIAGRSECAVWYKLKTAEQDRDEEFARSQTSHRHFIDVLRTVLGRLKAVLRAGLVQLEKSAPGKKAAKTPPQPAATKDILRNIYQGLPVEEPSAAFLESRQVSSKIVKEKSHVFSPAKKPKKLKQKKKTSQVATVFELEPQAEDEDFALWCLLKDCHQIRLYVRSLWHEYAAGSISLHIAALITDKAFLLIQHATNEFSNDYPALSTMEQVADHLDIDASVKGRTIEGFQCKGPKQGSSQVDAVELLCAPAFFYLVLLKEEVQANDSLKACQEGVYYLDNAHTFTRMAQLFAAEWTARGKETYAFMECVGTDTFTQELIDVLRSESLPLHIVIEFRTYMDIVETTDSIIGSPWKCLVHTRRLMQTRVRNSELGRRQNGASDLVRPESRSRGMCHKILTEGLDGAGLSNCGAKKSQFRSLFGTPWCVAFPVFGGALISRLINIIYMDGLGVCDEDCTVLSMAHIYRACRTSGLLRVPWKDMDFFITNVAQDNLKLPPAGYSSTALMTSAQCYGKAMGVTDREDGDHKQHNSLRTRLPLPAAMEERRVRLRSYSLLHEEIGKSYNNEMVLNQPKELASRNALFQMTTRMMESPHNGVNEKLRSRWKSCGRLTSNDLLKTLRGSVEAEETTLLFNLHDLETICLEIFEGAKHKVGSAMLQKLPKTFSFVQFTDEILWEAQEVGTVRMRQGTPTVLYSIAQFILHAIIQPSCGAISQEMACHHRDDTLRHKPADDSVFHKVKRRPLNDLVTDFTSLSIVGRDVSLEKIKESALPEESRHKLYRQQERAVEAMENMIADLRNGLDVNQSAKKIYDEDQERLADDRKAFAEGLPLPPLQFTDAERRRRCDRLDAIHSRWSKDMSNGIGLEESILAMIAEGSFD